MITALLFAAALSAIIPKADPIDSDAWQHTIAVTGLQYASVVSVSDGNPVESDFAPEVSGIANGQLTLQWNPPANTTNVHAYAVYWGDKSYTYTNKEFVSLAPSLTNTILTVSAEWSTNLVNWFPQPNSTILIATNPPNQKFWRLKQSTQKF